MNPFLLLWFALLAAVFWFMILRPRRQAARRTVELSRSLDVGDEVVTIGGLYGQIVTIDDSTVELAVAEGVTLRFSRRAIAGRAPVDEPEDEELEDDDEELEEDDLEDDAELGADDELEDDSEPGEASHAEPGSKRAPSADESSSR